MRLAQNSKSISGLSLVLLMLASAIIGALLSYMWVVGYYISLEKVYPKNAFATIKNVTFNHQNTRFFNVTIECPTSYEAKEPANVTRILVSTNDYTRVHDVVEVDPPLPYQFSKKGELKTFECAWNWANYTGQTVGIGAVIEDGSRFMSPDVQTPFVDLRITDIYFNSTISATHFNITVQSFMSPTTCNATVDITEISAFVHETKLNITETTPPLPFSLNPGDSGNFTCMWDWTRYQNTSVTVAVASSQGYMSYTIETTPLPVTFEITDVLFDVTNTTLFDVTVKNNEFSPTYLNVTKITLVVENRTVHEWTAENGTAVNPPIPFTLNRNSTETFVCPWNWTEYRDEEVTVFVYTLQGFSANHTQATPTTVILNITDVTFDPIDTNHFKVTIENSEFSLVDTGITGVFVIMENQIVANLTDYLDPRIPLNRTQSVNLTCPWDWGKHIGKNVTVVVEDEHGYIAYSDPIALVVLTISGVTFNPITTDYFNVIVHNPTLFDFTLTTINVSYERTSLNLTDNVIPAFPFLLPAGADYTFICFWENWTDHEEKEVTITIETLYGYKASYTCKIPSIP